MTETKFKQFGPEDAGQKVGWTTVVPNPDHESFYVVGAYATVGEQGGSVSKVEHPTTRERLWHDHLTDGLSRACSYAILVIPGEDTRIRNTDTVRFNPDGAQDVAGHSFHQDFNVDDEQTVIWGKGDEELVTNLRQGLEQHGVGDEYARLYLTINGGAGHGTHRHGDHLSGFPLLAPEVASNQIYDPTMSDTAGKEMQRFNEYAAVLGEQVVSDTSMKASIDEYSVIASDFVKSRENARAAFLRITELRQSMIAPTIAYTPEGSVRTWPYMDASEANPNVAYGMELEGIRKANFARASSELEREIKELKVRQQYALRGAQTMLTLTVDGRSNLLK